LSPDVPFSAHSTRQSLVEIATFIRIFQAFFCQYGRNKSPEVLKVISLHVFIKARRGQNNGKDMVITVPFFGTAIYSPKVST
jgi:hypothetical protein